MTVDVTVKGVTARIATVSKETMSCGTFKSTNKKVNKLAKNIIEATASDIIVCDNSGNDAGGGEGGAVFNSLGKKSE